ncbi:MAG: hypothetical protein KJ737_12560 [Proteobacteria bacterium]|nr:hypothetical protein [Pseudomonadota bacterium]
MMENSDTKMKWLIILYKYNVVTLISTGLVLIFIPDVFNAILGIPKQDPYFYGVVGSVWFMFGILSFLGLRSPVKFVPVLMLQLGYKLIWLVFIALPTLMDGFHPFYSIFLIICMLSYVVLDFKAIPFHMVFTVE